MANAANGPPAAKWAFLDDEDDDPPKQWIVPGFLAKGEVVALVASPFAGKSAIAARLASDVVAGAPFLGRLTRSAPVLFLAVERGRSTKRRLLLMKHGSAAVALSRFRLNLGDDASVGQVLLMLQEIKTAADREVGLVVIDTFAAATEGLEENSAKDMGKATAALARIAEAGPAVLVLHHLAKGTGEVRGSTAITGAVDAVLTIGHRGGSAFVKLASSNDGAAGDELHFRIEQVQVATDAETGEAITSIRVVDADLPSGGKSAPPRRTSDKASRVLEVVTELSANEPVPKIDVLGRLRDLGILTGKPDATRMAANRILADLKKAGSIRLHRDLVFAVNGHQPGGEQNKPNSPP